MTKIVGEFIVPAVYSHAKQEWEYSALRFVVTNHANPVLVQHVLRLVRS